VREAAGSAGAPSAAAKPNDADGTPSRRALALAYGLRQMLPLQTNTNRVTDAHSISRALRYAPSAYNARVRTRSRYPRLPPDSSKSTIVLLNSPHLKGSKIHTASDIRRVLVLDANQRSALAVIRSLGRRGLTIVAADTATNSLGAASRYTSSSTLYANPATSPAAFVQDIVAIVERQSIHTVISATDLTTMLLASQPNLSRIVRLMAPERASYENLTDKARLTELAKRLGILVPTTQIASSAAATIAAAHQIGFPVVLKPARSRYLKGAEIVSTSVEIVENPDRLTAVLDRSEWMDDIPCLVQRFIPGHGAGIFALYASSKPVAWFAHRRIREKPPTGGVSVLCESAVIDPVMQSAAAKLLSAAELTGAAMVEFRVATDGKPYLMEVNCRFWGSLQLAIDCGVDFPWLSYQITQGLPVGEPQPYVLGRRLRWLLGDLDSLIIRLRQGQSTADDKARAVGAFLRSFVDPLSRQEIMRISDPAPAIREIANWLKAL
jgi:predicted ATP-grasp superfamily ATP-dependent carboligase